MNTFEMKTVIHFGNNALDRLKEIPYKRVLVITDPFVVQSSMINLITAPLNSAGIEYDIFHDIPFDIVDLYKYSYSIHLVQYY